MKIHSKEEIKKQIAESGDDDLFICERHFRPYVTEEYINSLVRSNEKSFFKNVICGCYDEKFSHCVIDDDKYNICFYLYVNQQSARLTRKFRTWEYFNAWEYSL